MIDARLETLIEVARLGSYTRAAEKLHMTQPAVTQHIHKLEAHYGCTLVDTTGRAVRLTKAGEQVLAYARLQQVNELRLREQITQGEKPLRVGATLSIADYYLPKPLSRYLAKGEMPPHVKVGNTATLTADMLKGELDCALIEGIFDPTQFEARVWMQASFVAVAGVSHPLCSGEHTLQELCGYSLLLREPGSGTRAVLESALGARGMSPESFAGVAELGSFGLIKAALETTSDVSFMYEQVCAQEFKEGKLKKLALTDFLLTRSLYFLYPKGSGMGERCEQFLQALSH